MKISVHPGGGIYANVGMSRYLQPTAKEGDRRHFRRHGGSGLIARIDGRLVEVLDISLGGMRLPNKLELGRDPLRCRIVRRQHGVVSDEGALASAVLVRTDPEDLHLRFTAITYPLAKLIVHHIAAVNGVNPYIFR